ncbi:hypothetical protein JYU34_014707 [Plutella xylostella]|uniref:Double jelly roll-like domain-containing protein n=1 Tax=Plutella xylostella TaxID=51655 RepID=A0ABQ7Q998_PLUXY|nr:hypothetical protein JYU34_014707 [Plutella xylostella]
MSILGISDFPQYDNSIESFEMHTYNPYNNNFSENDEIRIPIHQQDIYILPSASAIYIEGDIKLRGKDDKPIQKAITLTNNPVLFLFQDIRYEMNGIEIDRIKNAGITTTMKSYISMNEGESKVAAIWGWNLNGTTSSQSFSAVIPLNKVLGFAEDYKKIVMNCKHELILNRGNSVLNSVSLSDDVAYVKINIQKVQWRVPHIKVSDYEKLSLLKLLEKDKPIKIAFSNWDLYEYPILPKTVKHSWSVKTASQIEKPRYVILGLQTDKKNNRTKDCSKFDHCNVTNVTLFLNSHYYPYESMHLKFNEDKYSILYDMYTKFRQSYYNIPADPLLNLINFKDSAPLFIIDCSRQNDNLKTGPVDVRIEIECSEYLPENTTAYCLIINDRLIEYKPLSKIVRKLS